MQKVSGSIPLSSKYMSPSSSGLGHRPFTAATGVRIPLGMNYIGEVAEWFNAMVLKTIEETIFPPRVQIPASPVLIF